MIIDIKSCKLVFSIKVKGRNALLVHIYHLVLFEHVCEIVPMICTIQIFCNIIHFIKHRSKFIILEQVIEFVTVLDLKRGSDHLVFEYVLWILVWLFRNEKTRVQCHVDIVIEFPCAITCCDKSILADPLLYFLGELHV